MRPTANVLLLDTCQGSYKNYFGNVNLILLWAGSYTCVGINGESATRTLACPCGLMDGYFLSYVGRRYAYAYWTCR